MNPKEWLLKIWAQSLGGVIQAQTLIFTWDEWLDEGCMLEFPNRGWDDRENWQPGDWTLPDGRSENDVIIII